MTARLSPTAAWWLGAAGAALMMVGSFGAGATRNRGGVLDAFGISFLSYGHGRGLLNIALTAGLVLLVVGWVAAGRFVLADRTEPGVRDRFEFAKASLWSATAPLLLAAPLMSRDVYSYLMQGAMVRDGFDPYSEGAAINPGPYLLEVSHDWRNTTTPYGPLHLWIGNGVTSFVGDNVMAGIICYKFISLAGFATIAWAVPRIARRLGGDPALALWLGVANPVMLVHMVGGMHNESVMVGLVSLGLVACLSRRFLLGTVLIGVAVSLKATAAVTLPFVVWMALHCYAPEGTRLTRRVGVFMAACFAVVSASVATVAAVTLASGTSWGWLAEISGNSKVVNPLSGATLAAEAITPFLQLFDEEFPYNTVLGVTRTIGSVLMLAGLVAVWWLFRQNERRNVMGMALAYMVAFVFNAVTLPWYFASSVSVAGTFTPARWLTRLTVGLSVIVALAFSGSGNHHFYNVAWMLPALIAGWCAAAYVLPRSKTPSPARA
ncbi:alpha-(1-_6)-mannopyranosyltransferase A [Corynebacterium appendicis]|uniref:alpha-(1->6)-mannopyranosyltransferase A n=1 Tax=Corynebacterium appendicis TaxID=163202 RepID=UPI002357B4E2|nr:alpha-(1->6)-mannopyranosyltransferase A [Corynebacterium appendicis]